MTKKNIKSTHIGILIMAMSLILVLLMHPRLQAYVIPGLQMSRQKSLIDGLDGSMEASDYWQARDMLGMGWHHPEYAEPFAEDTTWLQSIKHESDVMRGVDLVGVSGREIESNDEIKYTSFSSQEAMKVNGYYVEGGFEEEEIWISTIELEENE